MRSWGACSRWKRRSNGWQASKKPSWRCAWPSNKSCARYKESGTEKTFLSLALFLGFATFQAFLLLLLLWQQHLLSACTAVVASFWSFSSLYLNLYLLIRIQPEKFFWLCGQTDAYVRGLIFDLRRMRVTFHPTFSPFWFSVSISCCHSDLTHLYLYVPDRYPCSIVVGWFSLGLVQICYSASFYSCLPAMAIKASALSDWGTFQFFCSPFSKWEDPVTAAAAVAALLVTDTRGVMLTMQTTQQQQQQSLPELVKYIYFQPPPGS